MRIIQILALMLIFVSNSNAEDNDFKNENLDKLLKEFSKKDALLTNIITICDKSKCIIGSGIDFVPIEHSIKGSKGEVILRIFIPNEKNSEEKGHNLYDSYITFTVTPSFRVTVKEDSGSIIKKLLANPKSEITQYQARTKIKDGDKFRHHIIAEKSNRIVKP